MASYNEVKEYAKKNNITLATEDDELARHNPNAGLSIVNYMKNWRNAKTDAERNAAHSGADAIRNQYGGYTGNSRNGDYSVGRQSTGYDSTFNDQYAQARAEALQKAQNSEYKYDQNTDPIYQQYKKSYLAAAQRAADDAVGKYSAGTGTASSYTGLAAQQAANQYYSALADKAVEAEQNAYNRYQNDLSNKWNSYNAIANESDRDYTRYSNERSRVLNEAASAANYGDYSGLEKLGMKIPDSVKGSYELQRAITILQATGDTVPLERLGVGMTYYKQKLANELKTEQQQITANDLTNQQTAGANEYQSILTNYYRNNPSLIGGS